MLLPRHELGQAAGGLKEKKGLSVGGDPYQLRAGLPRRGMVAASQFDMRHSGELAADTPRVAHRAHPLQGFGKQVAGFGQFAASPGDARQETQAHADHPGIPAFACDAQCLVQVGGGLVKPLAAHGKFAELHLAERLNPTIPQAAAGAQARGEIRFCRGPVPLKLGERTEIELGQQHQEVVAGGTGERGRLCEACMRLGEASLTHLHDAKVVGELVQPIGRTAGLQQGQSFFERPATRRDLSGADQEVTL